jgi:hypothetical protein
MSDQSATQVMPVPAWSDPRIHLLDDTWLLTIFSILLATALPWLSGAFEIRFIPVLLGLLALGGLHGFLSVLEKRTAERRSLLSALHVAGVLIVGFIWMQAGGLQNPAFLLVFALPVVGAIFLSRWQPYAMAIVTLVTVLAVALAQAPELRWYVPGLNTAGALLASLFGQHSSVSNVPFPGFYAPSAYYVAMFEIFAVFIFGCAIAAEYLGTIFERLYGMVENARTEAERGQQLWTTLVEQLPVPALLVDADTLQIVGSSKATARFLGDNTTASSGAALFDTVRFSYPEMVQEMISQAGGTLPMCIVRVGDQLHAVEVQIQHLSGQGRRFALVSLADNTDEFIAKAALDVSGQAALVIDTQGRIVAFNKPARVLFPTVEKSSDATTLLALSDLPPRWWEQVLTGRRKTQVEIAPRIYEVTSSTTPWPGEEERLYFVTFLPVARAGNGARIAAAHALDATASTRTLVSLP